MLTLNQIKNQLSNIAVAHSNINHFHFGELYDFASSGVVDYPAIAVERNPIPYTNNTLKYSFNVYVMDLVHKDASNRDEVLSDTLQICLDILAILDRDASFIFSVEKNVTFNDFIDSFDQEVSGYWFKLDINVPAPLDNCAVPKQTVNVIEDLGEEVSPTPIIPPVDNTSLIFTIDTTKAGSASNTFVLPLAAGTTNISVNWGDGNNENFNTAGNKTHVYSTSGTYDVKITGTFVGIVFNNGGDRLKFIDIKQWGDVVWKSFTNAFYGCANLVFTYSDSPNCQLTSLSFQDAFRGTKINNDISWIPSNITNLSGTFFGCTLFNHSSISSIDVSNVTIMAACFASCPSFNQNLGSWNVSTCTNFSSMFQGATIFNNGGSSDINNWILNTTLGSAVNLSNMFRSSAFNQPLNNWDTTEVTLINNMFQLNSAFNQNISVWNTAKVTNMNSCFASATSFNQNLATWNISSLTSATDFSQSSGMSSANIDNLLNGWWAQAPSIPSNVSIRIGAGVRTSASDTAVTGLTSAPYNWTITNP